MKIMTVGSIPPEWGGPTVGGVANAHRNLVDAFTSMPDVTVTATIPARLARNPVKPPSHVPIVSDQSEASYRENADHADVILMFHIAHTFGQYQANDASTPCLGSINSWTPHLQSEDQEASKSRITRALGSMDALRFPSHATIRQGEELGFEYRSPVHVVYNGLGQPFSAAAPSPHHPRSGALFVGSIESIKRPLVAAEACHRSGVGITFVGAGSRESQAAAIPGTEFAGQLGPDDVMTHMLSSELLCMPSASEGLASVYMEAASAGTPVVGYKPAVDEISMALGITVGVGVAGDASTETVVGAIEEVRSMHWNRTEISQRARETFDMTACAQSYIDILTAISQAR